MLKRNKELQELVKKYKEEEKKKKNTATPKAIAAPTSQDSNLVGGASINNTSIMENSRLKRNEAPKTKTNLLRSEAPKTSIFETFNSDGYANTGKKYGDYYYNNYSELKDVPIYKDKNGKYFTYYNNKYDLLGTGITGSTMTSKSEQKRQLEEAKKLGFKEQEREKTKEYKKAEKAFSKLQKEYNLTDDELNQYIKSGKLSYKGLKTNLITKSMTDARETANTYRQMLDKGSIKKYENNSLLTAEQRLDLATNNLTKSQKSEFKEDLIRQNKKANSGYNDKSKYGYDGTLSGTIKALGSTINNVGDTLNKNIVQPMNNMKDYYEYGKKQNDLAIEYYKKMENKKNNAEAKQKEMDLYQKFNQDLMTDKSWGAEALRNANTQVESLKRQGIVATASSIAGGLVGTAVNPGAGTIAGAKIGGSIGYTLGSTPYTYKLEAGNQYQALSEMGVPDKIAKKYSRVTGGINAAIESGENVVDLITWGVGTKGSNAVSKEAVNKLVKDYGKEQVEEWANKGASKVAKTAIKSYLQNIGSEALEETSQEATSILGERLAAKESGIKRDVSLKEDLSRALEAGKSAAVSTALTAPISSIGGTLNTNMMNQIETKVNNKINNKTINNNNITTEETQINKQQDNIIDTPQEAKQEVRQEVIEDVQEKPNTQPTISESKINEIIENVTKNSKIEYNQKEIADLKKTLYDEVEKLGAKVEEIKQQQNVQEQKTPIKDAMKQYTENDIKRFSTGNNLIDGVNSNLKAFAEKFYDRETKRAKRKEAPVKSQKMFLGRISDKLSSKINNLLNNSGRFNQKYETKDTNIVISSDNIEHIYNHHGNEKLPGQIDVTPENLSKYAEAISNPDYIGLSSQLSRGNTPTLYFTKKINGYSVAVEVLSTKKQLYPQSYYVFESDSKEYKDFIKNNKLKKAWDVESDDSKSPDINVQDDTSAAFTTNNDTTKTNKSQIAPSQNSMQQNKKNTPKEKNTIEERIPDVIEVRQSPMDKTSLNKLSKNMAKELYLNNSQITDLKDVIQDFYRRDFNEYSKKDLFNTIKDKFSEHNEKVVADDSLREIQQHIRNTKVKVPEQIKEGISDYNNLRQSNFGKTKLGNTGMELDSFYDELASDYPAYFDSELTGEDQLLRIIDIANMDNSYTETYKLDDNYIQDITDYIDESIKDYKNQELRNLAEKEIKAKYREDKKTYALPKKITHKEVREQLLKEMKITPLELTSGKDIKNINFQLTDPIRVNEKVFGAEMGKLINEATIEKTKHNTAEKTRFLNKERNDIKELGIKARSKESAAVQKYAEKQYVNKYGETVPYGDKELMSEFKDTKTQEKIKKAASMLRNKYDRYIDEINDVITALGYDPIPKRKDYMKHFQELGDVFSQTGVPFNLNDMKAEDLPTDINGLTEFNKPGKNWFASAQQRYGNKTTYDAITGIDTYLEGAANLIYHTADIQRYRALSQLVRDTFGQKKGFENLDNLTNEETQQRIKDIQNNKLSKYAAWLDEQANNLAGKKGAIDRGVERFLGRRVYTGLNTIKKQVGSNMTGFNVRSAMTNFISSTIASAKTNKLAFVKGTISTINNMFKNDGFVNKSDFLTSRFGSDMLSAKTWQKVSNAGQIFMTGSDWFTSNQIVRSKYYEGLQKGMTEKQAIDYADDFASRVMGDRSQGMTAEAFNSKTLGLLTQFQLETNNQWQYMIHDSIMDYQRGSKINGGLKAGATVLFQLGQLAAFSYLFNELFQKLTGSRAAFDPIDIFKKLFGTDDDDDDKKSWDKRLSEANAELVDSIPFGNIFTGGGRIPISEAFTGISTLNKKLTGQKNSYGGEITWDDVKDDMLGSLPYYVLPTGYGQAKKTAKGLSMFTNDKEIKGSYTKSGRLRFPVEDTPENKIQAALFGQYASENAIKYVNEGHNTLTEKQQKELKTLDIPISEYWEIKSGLRDINNKLKGSDKTTDERKEIYYKYIDSLKISKDKKNILKKLQYKSYTDSDEDIIDYISSIKAKKSTKQALLERMGLDK